MTVDMTSWCFMKIVLSLLILLSSLTIFAQENPALLQTENVKTQVNQLLQSPLDSQQAWGAYLVGKYKLTDYQSALTSKLDQLTIHVKPETRLLNAIFDALIQIDADVMAERLMPYYERFPAQVMILLSKSPERNQKELLALLERPNLGISWFVICNALARTKAPGFAKYLLQDLEIVTNVIVTSDPQQGFGFGGGFGCGGHACGFGNYRPPPDYPPFVFYELTRHPARGVVAFSTGKHPVFYFRSEEGSERNANSGSFDCLSERQPDEHRMEYLAELLNTPRVLLDFDLKRNATLLWKGALNYRVKLTSIRAEVDRSYRQFARRFNNAGLLTDAEMSELKPKVKVNIHDMRSDVSTPLPE